MDDVEEVSLKVDEGVELREVLESEGIPVEEVLVAVDGTIVSKDRKLKEGETVRVMQVVAGG